MARRRNTEPSALKTGLVHGALSFTVFGGLAAAMGTGVHLMGDPQDASPRETIALFETPQHEADVTLKSRLRQERPILARLDDEEASWRKEDGSLPDLGVEYVDAPVRGGADGQAPVILASATVNSGSAAPAAAPAGSVRINGRLVRPGESYTEQAQLVSLPTNAVPGLVENVNGKTLPKVAPDGRTPAEVFARPFANPRGKPVVSLVVGGLGMNVANTKAAIEDLPAEVTLSFAPDTPKLQSWINKARAAGHEVLIELPMEASDTGGMKMHPQTLLAGAKDSDNTARLEDVLSRATGYFGVINYQGSKFAASEKAARPVLTALSQRGLALVDDGSLPGAGFGDLPVETGLRYTRAALAVDQKPTAEDIATQLLELEALAREKGVALGAAYAFPLTVEMAREWASELSAKGIVLAPASALAVRTPASALGGKPKKIERVRTGELATPPLKAGG
jgi:hypothetical protein